MEGMYIISTFRLLHANVVGRSSTWNVHAVLLKVV